MQKRRIYNPTARLIFYSFTKTLTSRQVKFKIELPHHSLVDLHSCFVDAHYPIFQKEVNMRSSPITSCFLSRTNENSNVDIVGLAADELVNIGDWKYRTEGNKAMSTTRTNKKKIIPLQLLAFFIQSKIKCIIFSQDKHIQNWHHFLNWQSIENIFKATMEALFMSQSRWIDPTCDLAELFTS